MAKGIKNSDTNPFTTIQHQNKSKQKELETFISNVTFDKINLQITQELLQTHLLKQQLLPTN